MVEVHNICCALRKELGTSHSEAIWQTALGSCLQQRGIDVCSEYLVPIDLTLSSGRVVHVGHSRRADLYLPEEDIIIELKSSSKCGLQSLQQLMTYLEYANITQGLLINFVKASDSPGLNDLFQHPRFQEQLARSKEVESWYVEKQSSGEYRVHSVDTKEMKLLCEKITYF